jgi:hypothetical protein
VHSVNSLKYRTKNSLVDFNAKAGREHIFTQTTVNESLHEIGNDNGVRAVNFSTYKNLIIEVQCPNVVTFIKLLGHLLMERHTLGFTTLLIDSRRHSSVTEVRSLMGAEYLVVAKVRGRLAANKRTTRKFDIEQFDFKKITKWRVKKSDGLTSQISSQVS